ncbi:hypothetical protein PIB30_019372 [Stylosanthes scabra]|uniref:Aminotransferase-like plant mobile domain-containing protein n=1 Tax=Stylosanthes scabra TaxID=79078 RepID=A0ABU6Y6I9_9FABA|nr:hypothetical protein [Stylosanthes scabra]
MGPRKKVQKRRCHDGEGSSRRNEQIHPLASWFNNSQALENYIMKWEKRQFVTPRTSIFGRCHAHESWDPYALQRGLSAIGYNDPVIGGQRLSVHKLSTEMRILHYLITYTLLPRGGNHDILQHDDVLLMWAMLEGHKICWPFIMVQNMLRLQGKDSKHVGYGPVWTPIFEHLGVNLDGYTKVEIGEANCNNERTLKQMRRQLEQPAQGVDEVEEEIDRMEQEEEAQREQEGAQGQQPQGQATMFDLVQEMRSMNQSLQEF